MMEAMEMEGEVGVAEVVVVMVEGEEAEAVDLGGEGEVEVVSEAVGDEIWNCMLSWELLGTQWRLRPVSSLAMSNTKFFHDF
jgi:hypothetical protein